MNGLSSLYSFCTAAHANWLPSASDLASPKLCAAPVLSLTASAGSPLLWGLAGLVLLCVLLLLLHILLTRKRSRKTEAQLQTIAAIGKVYSTILVLPLSGGEAQVIKCSDRFHACLEAAGIPLHSLIDSSLIQNSTQYIKEPYRDSFLKFIDLRTIDQRLAHQEMVDLSLEAADGWLYLAMIPHQRDPQGALQTVLLLARNITAAKEIEVVHQRQLQASSEQAQRASDAKTDFLRRMSHDIRIPINSIFGMLDIADHNPEDLGKQADCRNKIRQSAGFMLSLVDSVLDMNQLESGEVKLSSIPFSLRALLEDIGSVAQVQAKEAGVTFIQSPPQIEHSNLIGSPTHLRQVMQNIINNAIRYNRRGGSVTVSCRELRATDRIAHFEFTFADTGIGMSEEFQMHAFEPFARESDPERTAYPGSGLGLSIAKELIDSMGGTIRLSSRLGVGTTVTIAMSFPLSAIEAHAHSPSDPGRGSISGLRILLVEDNEINMEISSFLLKQAGAVLTCVPNGLEAVEAFSRSIPGSFDVILMDLMMPVMDGIEATQHIRSMDRPDAKTVPIFAMTANAFADDADRSLAAGMNEHLTKPLSIQDLLQTIVKYTQKA